MSVERFHWDEDSVPRFWDRVAETRLRELSFGRFAARSLLLACRRHLAPTGIHLDLGAGDGDLTAALAGEGYRVRAFEPSPVRRQTLGRRLAGLEAFAGFDEGDASGHYDVVLLCEVIEHVLEPQLDDFLRMLARRVHPGGTLIVTTPNAEDLELGSAICPSCGLLFHRWQHQTSFTGESLRARLEGVGFDTLAVHQLEFSERFYLPYADYLTGARAVPRRSRARSALRRLAGAYRCLQGRPVRPEDRHGTSADRGDVLGIEVSDYVADIVGDRDARVGAGSNLLYVGRRRDDAA